MSHERAPRLNHYRDHRATGIGGIVMSHPKKEPQNWPLPNGTPIAIIPKPTANRGFVQLWIEPDVDVRPAGQPEDHHSGWVSIVGLQQRTRHRRTVSTTKPANLIVPGRLEALRIANALLTAIGLAPVDEALLTQRSDDENSRTITYSQTTIPDDYYSMPRDQRRSFLRSVLGGMSPNPNVREAAKQNSKDEADE